MKWMVCAFDGSESWPMTLFPGDRDQSSLGVVEEEVGGRLLGQFGDGLGIGPGFKVGFGEVGEIGGGLDGISHGLGMGWQ